jgi:hypothetical protein
MRTTSVAFWITGWLVIGCGSNQPTATPGDAAGPTVFPLTLPMTVSDYFAPSGYMGDGASSTTAIVMDTATCLVPRPANATGDCYRVTYTPGSTGWGGVFWQYPANNWGAKPGKLSEAGATKVTFQAAGTKGGESVTFQVGGISDVTLPYHDSFKVTQQETLTTALAPYPIDLSGKTYDAGVLGAFAWTVAAPSGSSTPIVFYLDTILWE